MGQPPPFSQDTTQPLRTRQPLRVREGDRTNATSPGTGHLHPLPGDLQHTGSSEYPSQVSLLGPGHNGSGPLPLSLSASCCPAPAAVPAGDAPALAAVREVLLALAAGDPVGGPFLHAPQRRRRGQRSPNWGPTGSLSGRGRGHTPAPRRARVPWGPCGRDAPEQSTQSVVGAQASGAVARPQWNLRSWRWRSPDCVKRRGHQRQA